jgi:hypothetical protein
MGTRSRIGIMNDDGSIRSIYCHWDGYLSYNGVILYTSYNTKEKVNQLVDLGGLSSLDDTLDKTISYHNWRGEEIRIETHKNLDDFFSFFKETWEEYAYIFVDGEWWYYCIDEVRFDTPCLCKLRPALDENGLI